MKRAFSSFASKKKLSFSTTLLRFPLSSAKPPPKAANQNPLPRLLLLLRLHFISNGRDLGFQESWSPQPPSFPPPNRPPRQDRIASPRRGLREASRRRLRMAAAQLTPGAVAAMCDHAEGLGSLGSLKPVLQVVDVRRVTNHQSAAERFRMLLSDGVHTLQSMLATAENCRIKDGTITRGSIIHLQEFTCSTIQSRSVPSLETPSPTCPETYQRSSALTYQPLPLKLMVEHQPVLPKLTVEHRLLRPKLMVEHQLVLPKHMEEPIPVARVLWDLLLLQGRWLEHQPLLPRLMVEHRLAAAQTYGGTPAAAAQTYGGTPAAAAQTYGGTYSGGPGALGSSVASRPVVGASTAAPQNYGGTQAAAAQTYGGTPATAAQTYGGTHSGGLGALGSSVAPRPVVGAPSTAAPTYGGTAATAAQTYGATPAAAAQTHGGNYSGGPGALGSSAGPRPAQVANNLPYGRGGSYTGFQGTVADSVDRTVEPVSNVSYGGSLNANMMPSKAQQPPLNSHQNQRFAVPATAGGPPGNTYGRPTKPLYQQAPPVYMNRGPATKNDATSHVVPVAQLNPYQSRWTIKARVTAKTDIRTYNNAKGPGKVFSFDLLDKDFGEIRVSCFNAQVDQFYDQIEVDKVYLISRGTVKPADKKYKTLKNDLQINLDFGTSIQLCLDDNSIPRQQYNFRQISELEIIEVNALVDLVGVVTSVSPSGPLMRKDGTETQKQTLQLKDMSGRSVEITLWGKFCDVEGQKLQLECDSGLNPILAMKNVRVTEFNGRGVSTISTTQLKINPEFPEAENLQRWYETEGRVAACVSLSREKSGMGRNDVRKTVAQIKDDGLGINGKPDWITIKGSISHLKSDNFFYPACTIEVNGRQCNKKVTNNGDGTWHCERCDQVLPNCEYRYLLMCQIQDHTGVTYATAFQEGGMEIMGCSAQELSTIKEEDDAKFAEIIQGIRFQMYLFKLKVLLETFNDESRIKCNIVKAEKLDPLKESGYLLGAIDSILQEDAGTHPEVLDASANSVGFNNPGHCVPTSNDAYALNQSGQQINTHGGLSTPVSAAWNVQNCSSCGFSGHNAQNCPTGMSRQHPAASAASSYASSPGDAGQDTDMYPGASVPQPQGYGNGAPIEGYNRQSFVGATRY
ncbi:hypothetical protein PR202_gb25167 [Eleusine coracana subsp. coracana]|uniref:Replication protein A subunit n=1 Tax=Eleusine coracana subsp. coracana TaxID=191504 RepID=A0AAV5FN16_ELECO|nr:hypothetical protein PR202_gb25167 [Eleusine coracana subsp. coracana]